MATPPFLPDESKPGDSDIVSQYPAVERLFRDIVESWLLIDHDTDGEHKQVTLPELGADPGAVTDTGFVYTKDDSGDTELFYRDDSGAVVQITEDGVVKVIIPSGVLDAPATTSMFLYQSAAPPGWTKDTASTLNKHGLELVTTTAWVEGSNGATAFDSVFGSGKVTGGKVSTGTVAGTAISVAQMPAHGHSWLFHTSTGAGSGFAVVASERSASNQDAESSVGSAGGGATHAHGLTMNSHDHTLSLDLNFIKVIRITKD